MTKSKVQWSLTIFLVVCFALWPISYFIVVKSTPFEIVVNLVKNSPTVQKELGAVTTVRLSPLGYAAGFGFSSDGYADLELSITGQRASGKAEVDLDQKGGTWHVRRASLSAGDGRKIDINK